MKLNTFIKSLVFFLAATLFVLPLAMTFNIAFAANSGTINNVNPLSIGTGIQMTITGSGFGSDKGTSKICLALVYHVLIAVISSHGVIRK